MLRDSAPHPGEGRRVRQQADGAARRARGRRASRSTPWPTPNAAWSGSPGTTTTGRSPWRRGSRRPSPTPGTSSARPSCASTSRRTGSERSVVFSGDLGRPHLPIIRDPERVEVGRRARSWRAPTATARTSRWTGRRAAGRDRPPRRAAPGQAHHPRLRRGPHPGHGLRADEAARGRDASRRSRSTSTARSPSTSPRSSAGTPSATTRTSGPSSRDRATRSGSHRMHYLRDGRGVDGAERGARALHHHLRLRHDGSGPHPPPPAQQHRGPAQRHPHRRLPGGEHARPADAPRRQGGEHLRRAAPGRGPRSSS